MPDEDHSAGPLVGLSVDGDGQTSALIVAIDEAVDAQRALEHELREEFGTNNTDFRALLLVFRLRRRGRDAHPGDLTRGLGVSSGTASQIIARLGQAGLLERDRDPVDARSGVLTLTSDASARLSASTAAVRHDLDAIVETIDRSEEDRIIGLLGQVRDAFLANRRPSRRRPR